ncbi:MAG: hypothetical protein P8Y64_10180 [Gammaproteobacteria bacterium]
MKSRKLSIVVLLGAMGLAPAVWADHNSIWGEGWANMPNDTHDTRIDTLGDNEAFTDYVQEAAASARDDVDTVSDMRDSVDSGADDAATMARGR